MSPRAAVELENAERSGKPKDPALVANGAALIKISLRGHKKLKCRFRAATSNHNSNL